MLTCPKHSWYLLERSFTLFSHHFEMNWVRKMSLLVRSEILRLFFNILTANDKHSCHLGRILHNQFKSNFLRNEKFFFKSSLHFWNLQNYLKFLKKTSTSQLKYLQYFLLRKTWLLECLKDPVWEHPFSMNLLTGPKDRWNLHEKTCILWIDQSKMNWVRKCLAYSDLKS